MDRKNGKGDGSAAVVTRTEDLSETRPHLPLVSLCQRLPVVDAAEKLQLTVPQIRIGKSFLSRVAPPLFSLIESC